MSRLILVIANETLEEPALHDAVSAPAYAADADVLVIAPTARAQRHAAERRLVTALDRLEAVGVHAQGTVGDRDPVLAIDDALRWYRADEMIVVTQPQDESAWLDRVRDRVDLPILHVVVAPTAGAHLEAA
jgi:hypothetical protein